jgi:proline dehydrogenase
MLRTLILAASRNSSVERLVETAPVSRDLVHRFVPGSEKEDALRASRDLVDDGLRVSLDHLGEDTLDSGQAKATRDAYVALLAALAEHRLAHAVEVSVKLSAVGQAFDRELSVDLARDVCRAADDAGTMVTLDMEDHTTTDTTLDTLAELRADFPKTGVALQSYLRRTEADCKDLAHAGSRVRLCKGAYSEPESVAFSAKLDVDRSYVRCLNVLLAGDGYPMFATHDPRLIAIAEDRARWYDRSADSFEYQMLYGVRPDEQLRLAGRGYGVRVYVPYGTQWYGYLMRRMAERPANVTFFLRAVSSKR